MSLLGGGNHCEGLLQVQYHGWQGPVCGDHWGLEEASVACRQLGCGSMISTSHYVLRPQEMGPPWLYGAQCQGEEASLWQCSLGDWGPLSGCNCQCVVAVLCSDGTLRQIRLGSGGSPCAGTFELANPDDSILRCDLQKKEVSVLCRQLECGTALQWSRAHPGVRPGGQEQRFVTCQGTEPSIFHCKINLNFLEQCNLPAYTEVVCTGHMEAQLAGTGDPCAGCLEIQRGLTWGTVCDADLDLPTAQVVCQELQCGVAMSVRGGAHFGQGSGPVWTEAFHCVGNESLLFHCPREPGSQRMHDQDAGLRCSGESESAHGVQWGLGCGGVQRERLWYNFEQWPGREFSLIFLITSIFLFFSFARLFLSSGNGLFRSCIPIRYKVVFLFQCCECFSYVFCIVSPH
ncbi:Scavenger receptor cysteine-rich type 1 protein M130 [Heterocephalus glaber]|uniref:Scavenger receptor cysteine-rich type 1 protein M130 n=1 Tax=Heterocephalus glaber TaxID=10181 RepID=G5BLP8_HETGA|nr:Scavenger receptor cysteine-rich type 1 protein M130 [Heterocephalus glaber]